MYIWDIILFVSVLGIAGLILFYNLYFKKKKKSSVSDFKNENIVEYNEQSET